MHNYICDLPQYSNATLEFHAVLTPDHACVHDVDTGDEDAQ